MIDAVWRNKSSSLALPGLHYSVVTFKERLSCRHRHESLLATFTKI